MLTFIDNKFKFLTFYKTTDLRVYKVKKTAPNVKNKTLFKEPYNSCK